MNTGKQTYTYTVLRYVHDVATGEFINVGVVLHSPGRKFFQAEFRHTYSRLSAMFPDLDSDAFKRSMKSIDRQLRAISSTYQDASDPMRGDAATIAKTVLPADDSALQWSPVGTGITKDPSEELIYLFERLVRRYDSKTFQRRKDEDVWRTIRTKLDEGIAHRLVEKTIRSEIDELSFKHAWKNGAWHCYEPLSFDLADSDGIKSKAHKWVGHLSAIQAAPEQFKTYFIVGAPSDPCLRRAFDDAIAILGKSPVDVEIYKEHQADELVSLMEQEISSHSEAE
ncbi:DUF3037 domain-containing protein [Rhodomicrobium sp. Az07]|uniref:DUF3037 domain-containing protein n=1 Tax=Rhodomicrobium sp. Az07 TaxID=2839034 RepID=UPI001BE8D405|nr:DUF3037 domain-containing protein [Rhodomicrobium sp. Az07]MBT3069565.1 DUF3037 domain-containing protein [Rhodomicrobium sp. Az07]